MKNELKKAAHLGAALALFVLANVVASYGLHWFTLFASSAAALNFYLYKRACAKK